MSFQLQPDESVEEGIKRLACAQIDKALDLLTGRSKTGRDEAVHDARKCFKKVRALLRLVRNGLGSKVYQRENICFRDAGRPLTEVRDAKVLIEALDNLTDHFADHVSSRKFAKVRNVLLAHQRAVRRRVLDQEDAFAKVAVAIEAARQRVADWTIGPDKWSTLGKGLRRVYQSGARAMGAAAAQPTVENLHEWRKQVKYLWHQLQVLEPLWPKVMKQLANQAHDLASGLGDDHDLAMLRQMLVDDPKKFGDARTREALVALIDRRRDELQQAAYPLGRRLYSDRPKDFATRLKIYWKAWRSEVEIAHV